MKTKMNFRRKARRFILRFAKTVRIVTVAPVPALVLFTILFFVTEKISRAEYICALLTISVMPTLAYPLQKILPPWKHRGREGQRTLAMIMSTLGYITATASAFILGFGADVTRVFITYLLSGASLLIINKLFHIKASGHACGLAGPMGVIVLYTGPTGLIIGCAVFALMVWSSLRLRSHTASQLIIGAAVPNIIYYTIILTSVI